MRESWRGNGIKANIHTYIDIVVISIKRGFVFVGQDNGGKRNERDDV